MSIDTSGKALVSFWGWAANKGLMKANTAGGLRAACSQVLGALEDWETIDIRTLDVEDTYRRFQNKRAQDFTPESLEAYKRRFAQSVKLFLEYAENPSVWRFESRAPSKKGRKANDDGAGSDDGSPNVSAVIATVRAMAPQASGLVEYPFPLRTGRLAYLRLPADLTASEVKRLTTFLSSLAFEDVETGGDA